MRPLLILLLLAAQGAGAEEAEEAFTPADALYAPEEMTGTAAATAPTASVASGASYYSQAKLTAYDFMHPEKAVEGAELFINGQFVGRSPLTLNGYLINQAKVSLSARAPGYGEALRPAFVLPVEGEARVALLSEGAASWYTTPAFVAGLLAIAGSVAAYSQGTDSSSSLGTGLIIGGVGVIALAQGIAHLFHLPALQKKMDQANSSSAAIP